MAVTHHNDPKMFVGEIFSDRTYVDNSTWDDLEEESHVSRTLNLWSQGHHRPTVGSSMRDCLETIRSKHSTESFQGLIHTRLKGQIRMLELRQQALLRPTKRGRTAHEEDGREL